MKKRILGIALAICMMIFCVPMGVFAAESSVLQRRNRHTGRPVADCFASGFDCFGRVPELR